jgi:hypothetical protein
MPLFKCSQCGVIENTALSNYWMDAAVDKKPALCSQCDPQISKWHGIFERKAATGMKIGNDGFLYAPEEVSEGGYSYNRIQRGELKIVGDA